MNNIAIFASGSGTNAEQIIRHFKNSSTARVDLLLSNKKDAYALTRARNAGVDTLTFTRDEFYQGESIVNLLKERNIRWIVLAGFLWMIPPSLVKAYPRRIINIHPALLPAYGGKGMYGARVHEAVIANREKESGITIHYVDEIYDHGDIIFQARCSVDSMDTPESLALKIHTLEHAHFPTVIESLVSNDGDS